MHLLCSLGSTSQPPEWHHLHNWITLWGVVQEFLYEAELSVYFAPLTATFAAMWCWGCGSMGFCMNVHWRQLAQDCYGFCHWTTWLNSIQWSSSELGSSKFGSHIVRNLCLLPQVQLPVLWISIPCVGTASNQSGSQLRGTFLSGLLCLRFCNNLPAAKPTALFWAP